jgi:hypothetical protein
MSWHRFRDIPKAERDAFERKFRKKSRFLVDENLGAEAARVLENLGWNTVYTGDVGLNGRDDTDVYSFAWKEDRILLTHDTDFLDDTRFPPNRNAGVIVLPGATGSAAPLEREMARLHVSLAPYREIHRYTKIHVGADGEWAIKSWDKGSGKHTCTRLRFGRRGRIDEWRDD